MLMVAYAVNVISVGVVAVGRGGRLHEGGLSEMDLARCNVILEMLGGTWKERHGQSGYTSTHLLSHASSNLHSFDGRRMHALLMNLLCAVGVAPPLVSYVQVASQCTMRLCSMPRSAWVSYPRASHFRMFQMSGSPGHSVFYSAGPALNFSPAERKSSSCWRNSSS